MSFELNASKVMEKNIDLNGLTLRVGTYNIKHGAVTGLDFKIIAEDIKALDLDIVGFQEIDKYTSRVSGLDTPKIIAKFADYDYYYSDDEV